MDLVTGGAGFVGSHLVDRLVSLGRPVRVLDAFIDRPSDRAGRQEANVRHWQGHVDVRRADIRDAHQVEEALRGVSRVFHLAAMPDARESLLDPDRYVDVNVRGTSVLLQAMERRKVKRLVYCSSSSVYGPTEGHPTREDELPRPASVYGATKVGAEGLVHAWATTARSRAVIVRPFSVYGPRQRPDMAIPRFMRAVRSDSPVMLFGPGDSTRDYTYVTDVVEGMVRAADLNTRKVRIFNLGGGHPVRLRDLVDRVSAAVGHPARLGVLPTQPGDVAHTHADPQNARKLLKWKTRVDIDNGIRRTLLWMHAREPAAE